MGVKWYARISPARLLTANWRYVSTQFFPVGAREYVLAIDMPPKLWYATQFCASLLHGKYTIEGERNTRASHVFACELIRGVAVLLFPDGSRRKAFLRRSSIPDDGRIDLSLFKVYAARRSLCYGRVSECHPAPRTWRVIFEALQRAYPSFFVTLPV